MKIFIPLTVLLFNILCSCATPPTPDEIALQLKMTMESAGDLHAQGMDYEAYQLLNAITRIHENYPGAEALRADLSPEAQDLFDTPLLGSNFARRPQYERSTIAKVLLYLPDRIFDALDIISFDIHLGPGAYAGYHITRAFQAGIGARMVGGFGWHDHRSLGIQTQVESAFDLICFGSRYYSGNLFGTSGVKDGRDALFGMHLPGNGIYQDYWDYWSWGGSLTVLVVGVDSEGHFLEIFDFLAGFTTYDFLNDDFAHTRSLQFDSRQKQLLKRLAEIGRRKEWVEEYKIALLLDVDDTDQANDPVSEESLN